MPIKAEHNNGGRPAPLDAYRVTRRLTALPERTMRAARLAQLIETTSPRDAAWLLDVLATVGSSGGAAFSVSLFAAVDLLSDHRLSYRKRRAIFEAADSLGLDACKELLLSPEPAAEGPDSAPRPRWAGARPLTLGERKSLARSRDRTVLQRLLDDPHTDVVARLLSNPRMTEDDILRIATARRSSADVLDLIVRSTRWGTLGRIRRALIRNPRLRLPTALRMLGLLNRQELRELIGTPHLPTRLVAALRRRLRPVI